jgi:hypothetical protein
MCSEEMDLGDEWADGGGDAAEVYCDEFFRAARAPATAHEEWLLRLCAQLMHREAAVVSVLEAQAGGARGGPAEPGGRGRCRRRSRRTATSTAPSTATGDASWSEC